MLYKILFESQSSLLLQVHPHMLFPEIFSTWQLTLLYKNSHNQVSSPGSCWSRTTIYQHSTMYWVHDIPERLVNSFTNHRIIFHMYLRKNAHLSTLIYIYNLAIQASTRTGYFRISLCHSSKHTSIIWSGYHKPSTIIG